MQPAHGNSDRTGWRILIAGTGGQGVLTAARLLCDRFVELGHQVVSGQLHGMAQRGGAVQSGVIIDGGISPVIPAGRADYVLGCEPAETVRALPLMSARTTVYMNTCPVVPFVLTQHAVRGDGPAEYPPLEELTAALHDVAGRVFTCDATAAARRAGSGRALNMVMLGCLLGDGGLPCSPEGFWSGAATRLPPALREINTRAFWQGVELAGRLAAGRSGVCG